MAQKIGPNCLDPDQFETAEPLKNDCISQALHNCMARALNCMADQRGDTPFGKPKCADQPLRGCVDDINCIGIDCWEELQYCFCDKEDLILPIECDDTEDEDDGLDKTVKSPSVTGSEYGEVIPIVFGRVILGGNVIWAGNPRTETVETRVVEGAVITRTTEDVAFLDFAVGLCRGEIDAISRVWFDDTLVVDHTQDSITQGFDEFVNYPLSFDLSTGAPDQLPNAHMLDINGVPDEEPGYRDLCYLLIKGYPVVSAASRFPKVRVEIIRNVSSPAPIETVSDFTDAITGGIHCDFDSQRLLYSADGTIRIADAITLEEIDTGISTDSGTIVLDNESTDVFVKDGSNVKYLDGRDKTGVASLSSVITVNPKLTAVSHTRHGKGVVTAVSGSDILVFEYTKGIPSLVLGHTYSGGAAGTPVAMLHMRYGNSGVTSTGMFYIGYNTSGLVFGRRDIANPEIDYTSDETILYTAATVPGFIPSGVFANDETGVVTIYGTIDTDYCMVNVTMDNGVPVVGDVFYIDGVSATTYTNKGRRSAGNTHKFFHGGKLHVVNLATGASSFAVSSTVASIGGDQLYDSVRDTITFRTTGGDIARVLVNRAEPDPVVSADIVEAVLRELGFPASLWDTTNLDIVEIDGYVIAEQNSAKEVLEELMDFFAIKVADRNGKLVFLPVGYSSIASINADNVSEIIYGIIEDSRFNQSAVTVKYFDVDKIGYPSEQLVTRDMTAGEEDDYSNYQELTYEAAVFTSASVARKSAELYLFRYGELNRRAGAVAGWASIDIEPGDFIDIEGVRYCVREVTVDATNVCAFVAYQQKPGYLSAFVELAGYTIPSIDRTVASDDTATKQLPVMASMPPVQDDITREKVYAGWINPYEDDIAPSTIQVQAGQAVDTVAVPTREVLYGRLQSVPDVSSAVFTRDDVNTFTVVFYRDVTSTDFPTATEYEDIYTSTRKNLLFVGQELIQYTQATIAIDNRTVTFSGIYRGRFGTDKYVNSHQIGESVVAADSAFFSLVDVPGSPEDGVSILIGPKASNEEFVNRLGEQWGLGATKIKKINTGPTSEWGVRFLAFPRVAYRTFFSDSVPSLEEDGEYVTAIAVLKGVYDRDTLLAALEEDDYPPDFFSSDASTNSYIHRLGTQVPELSRVELNGLRYPLNTMTIDGFSLSTEIPFVIFKMKYVTGEVIDPIYSFTVPATGDYEDYQYIAPEAP